MPLLQVRGSQLRPQQRDIDLLCGLFEARIMTAAHLAAIYFEGKREYTKKRLQRLKSAGLISERRRRINEPSLLSLTPKAFHFLRAQGELSHYPEIGIHSFERRVNVSELTLRHELEVLDVKAAFYAAVENFPRYSLSKFSTWPLLYDFRTKRIRFGGHEASSRG